MPDDSRTALASGSLLHYGTYRIEAVLGADEDHPTGRGGFGITYRALDKNLQRIVAIKEFFPSGCFRDKDLNKNLVAGGWWKPSYLFENQKRFLAEGRILATLSHPGIVKVFNLFEENETVYLVMEYLHGQTLQQLRKSQPGNRLSLTDALGYIEQAGNALMAVHGAGLLHRDIKPDNLFVREGGQVVLIDFGCARTMTDDGSFRTEFTMTSDGFSPLENYDHEGVRDCRSDVYSLSATLYNLLTGLVPTSAIARATGKQLLAPHVISPDVSEALSDAILQGVELVPDSRPDSIDAFLKSLRSATTVQKPIMNATPNPVASSPGSMMRPVTLMGMEMIPIPAGEFLMVEDDQSDNPGHTVYLDAYYIGKFPVTVKEYFEFVRATRHREPKEPDWGWKDDHPIVNVSWDDAMAYCGWLSQKTGRKVTLPSEAQWEKAARGTDGRKYPWGNEWDASRLQCSKKDFLDAGGTAAVGSHPSGASPYGVLDMAGNVYEWCLDGYDGRSRIKLQNNPIVIYRRAVRSSSWMRLHHDGFQISCYRTFDCNSGDSTIGFRVVAT